jgi:hypothetical protein
VRSLSKRRALPEAQIVFFLHQGESEMKRNITLALLGLVLLMGSATNSSAEVKRVQMHIAGYLCGN